MTIPKASRQFAYAENAYFFDCYTKQVPPNNDSALDLYLYVIKQTPSWVSLLMEARNQIVAKLGLKNLGRLQDVSAQKMAKDYQEGDGVGIFTLISKSDQEMVLEERDKHLDVRVSFFIEHRGETKLVHASTVVHVHNRLGKIYMFFVTPMHKIIVPSLMKKLDTLR